MENITESVTVNLQKDNPFNALTGAQLREELNKENLGQEPLIEELIYKDSITMFYAKSGVGKSVVTANLAASASKGSPVFGFLQCKRPLKIGYCQMEGSRDEQLSRLKMIEAEMGEVNCEMLSWHTPNIIVEDSKTFQPFYDEMDTFQPFDIIIFDPLYAMTVKGLTHEPTCLAIKKFLDSVKYRYHCSIIVNNHTPKDTYANTGEKIKKKDSFGITWLNANLDGSFYFEQQGDNQLYMELAKSRGGSLLSHLMLKFDIATFTLSTLANDSCTPARIKVKSALLELWKSNPKPTATEICKKAGISLRHLMRIKTDEILSDFANISQVGKHLIYERK